MGRVHDGFETMTQQVRHDSTCAELAGPEQWTIAVATPAREERNDRRADIEALVDLVEHREVVQSFREDVVVTGRSDGYSRVFRWPVKRAVPIPHGPAQSPPGWLGVEADHSGVEGKQSTPCLDEALQHSGIVRLEGVAVLITKVGVAFGTHAPMEAVDC